MTKQFSAIETIYKGHRFRSRLEARWAVFFDALGVPYEYEKEGYDLGEAGWYLPDFWLPRQQCWVEIKGETPTEEESRKASALASVWRNDLFCLGPVYIFSGQIVAPVTEDIPIPVAHAHYGSGYTTRAAWQLCPVCREFGLEINFRDGSDMGWHCDLCDFGVERDAHNALGTWLGYTWAKGDWLSAVPINVTRAPQLLQAYTAAQQARFEHGETPKIGLD